MSEDPRVSVSEPRLGSGFTLSSLFLLVALFAVLSAVVPLLKMPGEGAGPQNAVLISALCGVYGGILGVVVGLQHFRKVRGVVLGIVLGVTFGAFSGPIVSASISYPLQTFLVTCTGAAVLLGLAVFFRWMNDDDPVSNKDLHQAKMKEWLN